MFQEASGGEQTGRLLIDTRVTWAQSHCASGVQLPGTSSLWGRGWSPWF